MRWLIEVDLFKTHAFLNGGLDKVLCRMRKSLIIETLYEVSIVFRKESFINAKKVLNLIQSLTNEKKVINPNGVPYIAPSKEFFDVHETPT